MKSTPLRTGKEVYQILSPLYKVASSQIRQHFLDPGVILVLAGAHPATKIIINNPSQEILHEVRTLNLLLERSKIRFRISTKYLRKEVNNLQRLASIIIESIPGYERLAKYAFPKENALQTIRGFEDIEKWMRLRIEKDKKTQKEILNSIEEGEVPYTELNLIDESDKNNIINEFLNQEHHNDNNFFDEDKFFNLLSRVHKSNLSYDQSLDDVIKEIKIILKNSHFLTYGLNYSGISEVSIETLIEMLESKYTLIRKLAEKTLEENSELLRKKLRNKEIFPSHDLERKMYNNVVKKIEVIKNQLN